MNENETKIDIARFVRAKDELWKPHDKMSDADYSRALGLQKIGLHWISLPTQTRSSFPHAESLEEEFIFVVTGTPHLWVNGYIYELQPGVTVGFPSGTGIAHCLINNTDEPVEAIVIGDKTKKENKCSFPINPELAEKQKEIWWQDYPPQEFGPHDGAVGNLSHKADWHDLPFVKSVTDLPHAAVWSYPGDSEKFGAGARLTDAVGLKSLGIWHEVLASGRRSSWPHAHKIEEEFAIILKGRPRVWMNGEAIELKAGDCVFFKPGTNLAHTIINDSGSDVEYLGGGQADDAGSDEKIIYPLHPTRNEECREKGVFWEDAPAMALRELDVGGPKPIGINVKKNVNASEFLDVTEKLLYQREHEYSLLIGLCELRRVANSPVDSYGYYTVEQSGQVIGGALVTEKNLILSAMPEPALQAAATQLFNSLVTFPGVVGPAITADAFSRLWCRLSGKKRALAMAQKIYKISKVAPPAGVAGELRKANEAHAQIVGKWLLEFTTESLPHEPTTIEKATELAISRIAKGEVFLWIDESSEPVSMNFVGRPTKNGISVSAVYTPKQLRNRGFASAVVAHTSQAMIDRGKTFCVLYTDLSNPTSNKIYQNVGYEEVAKSKNYIFVK